MAGSGSSAALSLASPESRIRRSASVGGALALAGGGIYGAGVHTTSAAPPQGGGASSSSYVPPPTESESMASGKAVHGWVLRSVDISSYLASAIAQSLPPPEPEARLSPEAHAFESVRSMSRSELDAALRAAKIEGLADDVWAAISRLNAGRNRVATAVDNLEKPDSSVAPQRSSLSPGA